MSRSWTRLGALCLSIALTPAPAGAQDAPADRAALLDRAATELSAGRQAEAARLLARAADELDSVEALLRLARIQSARKDVTSALESLRRARVLAPNSEDVLSAFAQVALTARAVTPAVSALEALTRMVPSDAQYPYLLGVGLMQAGDLLAAVDALQQAERLGPDRPLTLIALGLALNSRKQYEDAKPFLLRSLDLEPANAEGLAALAEAEEGLDHIDHAEQLARRALAAAGAHPTADFVLGLVAMRQGRHADARASFERVIAADPSTPRAYYQLSLACARLGDEPASHRYLDLYRQRQREMEDRVNAIRAATGRSTGGMHP